MTTLRLRRRLFSSREHYISAGKTYQFIPSAPVLFDSAGKVSIYKHEKLAVRWMYLHKVYVPVSIIWATFWPKMIPGKVIVGLLTGGPLAVAWGHMLFRSKLVREVQLMRDGATLEISYIGFPFLHKTETLPISAFQSLPVSPLMAFWHLKPFPRNILAVIDNPITEILPCHVPAKSGFFLFPNKPESVNPELLGNVLNGVTINTQEVRPNVGDFKHRYIEKQASK